MEHKEFHVPLFESCRETSEDADSLGDASSQPDTVSIASRTSQNTADSDKVSCSHVHTHARTHMHTHTHDPHQPALHLNSQTALEGLMTWQIVLTLVGKCFCFSVRVEVSRGVCRAVLWPHCCRWLGVFIWCVFRGVSSFHCLEPFTSFLLKGWGTFDLLDVLYMLAG